MNGNILAELFQKIRFFLQISAEFLILEKKLK